MLGSDVLAPFIIVYFASIEIRYSILTEAEVIHLLEFKGYKEVIQVEKF